MMESNKSSVLVLDMDGVVIQSEEVFSVRFSKKYHIQLDEVVYFFKNEFQRCLVGKSDLKVEIKKYFKKWNYTGTVDEILEFWFFGECKINKEVLGVVNKLRKKGVKVYLATNNEKYRIAYLSETIGLKDHFDEIYSSSGFGVGKPDLEFFKILLKAIKTEDPSNVYFVDDSEENIKGAKLTGITTHLYKDFNEFEKWTSKLQ